MKRIVKQGLFDWQTMTVKFGGALSKPHNIFTATAIKIPDYKYKVKERESLGNGWYGSMEINEYEETNLYVIIKDGVCIGQMRPYHQEGIKSSLELCNEQAIKYLKNNNITYKP